jgi:hypothetical protein
MKTYKKGEYLKECNIGTDVGISTDNINMQKHAQVIEEFTL